MSGTAVTRTCATCDRQVHDLGAMTADEAEALVSRSGERICVRYVRGADGVTLTADRPTKPIQKGPYAGLSAAALAAAVALSQAACSPAVPRAGNTDEPQAPSRMRTAGPMGTLSGQVARADDGTPVVVISESTGEEFVARIRKGSFSLDVPEGTYTISVNEDNEFTTPAGVGGVEVHPRRTATIELELGFQVMGDVRRLYPDTLPPPLSDLNETPVTGTTDPQTTNSRGQSLVDWVKDLFR
jgi:hypothetical protein